MNNFLVKESSGIEKNLNTNKILVEHKILRKVYDFFASIFIRSFLLAQLSFFIYFLTTFSKNNYFTILVLAIIIILTDGIYITVYRHGKEYSW